MYSSDDANYRNEIDSQKIYEEVQADFTMKDDRNFELSESDLHNN